MTVCECFMYYFLSLMDYEDTNFFLSESKKTKKVPSGVARDGKSGEADSDAGDGFERVPAGFGSGTGSDDIVDKEDTLPDELGGVAEGEDTFHIVETLLTCLLGLCIGVASADEVVVTDGSGK